MTDHCAQTKLKHTAHSYFNRGVFIAIAIGAVWRYFDKTFVPTGAFAFFLPYITLGTVAVYAIYLNSLRRQRLLIFSKWPASKDAVARWFTLLFALSFLYFALWLTISSAIPGIYTSLTGTEAYRFEYVKKKRTQGRRMGCSTRLVLPYNEGSSFSYCLSEEAYSQFSSGRVYTKISVKQSSLGFNVTGVTVK